MEKNKLISVVVVTYNFEEVVLETLESIKNQTYRDIELVITDDNSKDKTIEICKKWCEDNKERFNNIVILESDINRGPTANYNRGLRATKGEWIKYISDDIMAETFIENSLKKIKENPEIEILFSISQVFSGNWKDKKMEGFFPNEKSLKNYLLSSSEQLKLMHKDCYVSAPTNFIKKSLLEEMGYCNEEYKFFEDYPLWIKILESGRKLYLNEEVNVYYRRWEKSVSYNGENYLNKKLVEFHREYFEKEQKYKIKNRIDRFEKNLEIYRDEVIIRSGNKGQTTYSKMLRYLQPSRYKKTKYKYILLAAILGIGIYIRSVSK